MAKGRKRLEISHQLAEYILEYGLGASNLRALAAAVGTSDRMLLYYFKDKTDLIASVLGVLAERLSALLDDYSVSTVLHREELFVHASSVLQSNIFHPYMNLRLELAVMAARRGADSFYSHSGEAMVQIILSWLSRQLTSRTAIARDKDAVEILQMLDGQAAFFAIGMIRTE
ncbi:MAG: TetR/AcrR family transcriptional regulator [Sphingomonadales bacterium]|jgi:AcrR family transcriptional regulator